MQSMRLPSDLVLSCQTPDNVLTTFDPGNRILTDEKSSAVVYLSNGTKLIVNEKSRILVKVLKQDRTPPFYTKLTMAQPAHYDDQNELLGDGGSLLSWR